MNTPTARDSGARCTCGALDYGCCFCNLTMAEWVATLREREQRGGRLR